MTAGVAIASGLPGRMKAGRLALPVPVAAPISWGTVEAPTTSGLNPPLDTA